LFLLKKTVDLFLKTRYTVYMMRKQTHTTKERIEMTKSEIRKLIAKELETGIKITVLPASKKKVKTFRNSSSVTNRGRKQVNLASMGYYAGRA